MYALMFRSRSCDKMGQIMCFVPDILNLVMFSSNVCICRISISQVPLGLNVSLENITRFVLF